MGRHEGRKAFASLVRQTLAAAAGHGWNDWWWCDPDFADWPLGEREGVQALNQWARRGRRLHLLARDFQTLRQTHVRLVQWRVTWDHLIDVKACPSAAMDDFPSGIWTPGWCLHRIDVPRSVVLCTDEPQRRTLFRQQLQGWWDQGSPAFPATTLGL
jgi:hypothetical protein